MIEITGHFTGAQSNKEFHIIAQNVFEALKVLVEEANVYIGSNDRLRLPIPHILNGVSLRNDRDGVIYLGVVYQYSNVLSKNDFYRIWTNYLKALGNGNII